jgi:hypothetical protein
MLAVPGTCPRLSALQDVMIASKEFQDHVKESAALRASVSRVLGISPSDSFWSRGFDRIFDNLSCRVCNNKPLPCNKQGLCMTGEEAEAVLSTADWEYRFEYQTYEEASTRSEEHRLRAGVFLKDIFARMREKVLVSVYQCCSVLCRGFLPLIIFFFFPFPVRFFFALSCSFPPAPLFFSSALYFQIEDDATHRPDSEGIILYSGHDASIASVMAALGQEINWPGYSANIIFELWQLPETDEGPRTHVIRVFYNGVVQNLRWCESFNQNEYYCTVPNMQKYLTPFISVNREKECKA